ncbi:MAG: metallopeptidase family protein [Kineosporiaceae bacterium]
MPVDLDDSAFDRAVSEALDTLPPPLARLMDNVVVLVADEPPPEVDPETLGLYEGTPLTERGEGWAGSLPDRITIFRRPLLEMCADRAEVADEVRITVVHEVAHHFGIDDDRLHELGWG